MKEQHPNHTPNKGWVYATVTCGGRPRYIPNERNLHLVNNVGLYVGNAKIDNYQNGRLYLTSFRLIYISNCGDFHDQDHSKSVALDLSLVEDVKYINGFMKSSPKISLTLKRQYKSSDSGRDSPITWTCPICFQPNEFSLNQKDDRCTPVCSKCGVRANMTDIARAISHQGTEESVTPQAKMLGGGNTENSVCVTCLYENINCASCERCGSPIVHTTLSIDDSDSSAHVPNFSIDSRADKGTIGLYRLSFRSGGSKTFFEKLQLAVSQARWLRATGKKRVNVGSTKLSDMPLNAKGDITSRENSSAFPPDHSQVKAGIHGLQESTNLRNIERSAFLSSSLGDLQNLMDKSVELSKVGEEYKRALMFSARRPDEMGQTLRLLSRSKHSIKMLGTLLTTDEVTSVSDDFSQADFLKSLRDSGDTRMLGLYEEELCRQVYDYIMANQMIRKGGELISLLDFYCLYNKKRGFFSISPSEFLAAVKSFEEFNFKLQLLQLPFPHTRDNSSQTPKSEYLNAISSSTMDATAISNSVLNILKVNVPNGCSALDLQGNETLKFNFLFLQSILHSLVHAGAVCFDSRAQGEIFFLNEIISFTWE
ncbi:hypothetical protein OGAPHI_003568 [Ogataea philodendri]|uniref:Vacuolar protein-sorting-associated protein 36 n=1 Tax=Ogataea philodendri TaxID=1378263 RepID=A0A9P8P653_9ASCO|nr:uncharacterized protein OGAPHI_003568 [Ogataea philodendri]KAH3665384.1 hypothetical protein OGAPHI_003568 [Ogataea philodendri]